MSMSFVPQGDGTEIVTTDFPYYLVKHRARYYQHRSLDETIEFIDKFRKRVETLWGGYEFAVDHRQDKQTFIVTYHRRLPLHQRA